MVSKGIFVFVFTKESNITYEVEMNLDRRNFYASMLMSYENENPSRLIRIYFLLNLKVNC